MDYRQVLKKLRKEKNVTQEQVGNMVGVCRETVSRWESDDNYTTTAFGIDKLQSAFRKLGHMMIVIPMPEEYLKNSIKLYGVDLSKLDKS